MAEVKKPDTKLISTVTAEFADNIETIKNNLKVHLSSPVQWEKTVYAMLLFGINTFIEVGPTGGLYKTILGLSKTFNKDVEVYTTTDSEGLEKVLQIQKKMDEKIVHSSAYAIWSGLKETDILAKSDRYESKVFHECSINQATIHSRVLRGGC